MRYRGLKVTTVRNVTDIDDKILAKSADSMEPGFEGEFPNEQWWALAYRFEKVFAQAYAALGIDPPTYEPRATGHIPEMFALIQRLIDRGHAYPALDDSGDVYFDVRSWDKYGALTNQSVEDMQDSADADPRGKRDPRDFALWKGYKEGEPLTASWESPWGRGRPGWHLECSAMAGKYLGSRFDIHGGGLDLRSRTMRMSWRSRLQLAMISRISGCITAWSPMRVRRCRSLSVIRFRRRRCCRWPVRWWFVITG